MSKKKAKPEPQKKLSEVDMKTIKILELKRELIRSKLGNKSKDVEIKTLKHQVEKLTFLLEKYENEVVKSKIFDDIGELEKAKGEYNNNEKDIKTFTDKIMGKYKIQDPNFSYDDESGQIREDDL